MMVFLKHWNMKQRDKGNLIQNMFPFRETALKIVLELWLLIKFIMDISIPLNDTTTTLTITTNQLRHNLLGW